MTSGIVRAALAGALAIGSVCALGAQRTFVAPDGNDANACTLVAPCRGFAAAMGQTSAGGEIIVLGSAGYGAVAITQSVKIIAPAGVYAGITVASGNGVTIGPLAASDVVVLRGLTINAQGGSVGVSVLSTAAGAVYVEDCVVDGMSSSGVRHSGSAHLYVKNLTATNNYYGVYVAGAASPSMATIERSRFSGGYIGVAVAYGKASVRESVAANHSYGGMVAGLSYSAGLDGYLDVESSTAAHNTVYGIGAANTAGHGIVSIANSSITNNANAGVQGGVDDVVRVSNSTIVGNQAGVGTAVVSMSGNALAGNAFLNSFTPPALPKQ